MLGGRSAGEVPKSQWPRILRKYGFGKPDLARALRSARSAVTLICQDEIQPFLLEGSEVKTNELRFHSLPWPREVLQENGMLDAERCALRCHTLSSPIPVHARPTTATDMRHAA
jgi:hypothetical protein